MDFAVHVQDRDVSHQVLVSASAIEEDADWCFRLGIIEFDRMVEPWRGCCVDLF